MKRLRLLHAAMLTAAAVLFLQGANGIAQCTICVSATDQTCEGEYEDCDHSISDCAVSTVFQVPCTGTYELGAKVASCSDVCNCSACVLLEKVISGTLIYFAESDCLVKHCAGSISIGLEAGYDYRLHVCKRPCDFESSCADCDSLCKAVGWLTHQPSTTACP